MNIYDMLTYGDRNLILNYIDEYAFMDDDDARRASLDHLLRKWAENKERLFHLFGDKFILERHMTFHMSADEICRLMDKDYSNERSPFYAFRMAMRDVKIYGSDVPLRTDYSPNRWLLNRIVENTYVLAQNCYEDERFSIALPDGKAVIFDRGCKPMRLLAKVAKAYGLEEQYEAFRLWHSQKLNQKGIEGTVCLSIHPLDFMTMSDNDCDWGSCMSWQDQGCYRSGTVECMNSPCVVVAYIKANEDMDVPGGTWNNKKWRSLFIVTDDLVTSIKGYPYQHEEINKNILNWFKEFLPANYGEPKQYDYCAHGISFERDSRDYPTPIWNVEFYTSGHMYNDFGTVRHTGMFVEENMPPFESRFNRDNCIMIDYSGPSVCMCCGQIGDMPTDETELCCVSCSYEQACESCECHLHRGEGYELDGRILCEDCYYEYRTYDPFTHEAHYEPDMNKLFIVPSGISHDTVQRVAEKGRFSSAFSGPMVYSDDLFWDRNKNLLEDKVYGQFFTCEHIRKAERWWSTFYYVSYDDLTPAGRQVIDSWLDDEGETYESYTEIVMEYINKLDE